MCECFQIGGPFISEDPNCPIHGVDRQREEEDNQDRWDKEFVPAFELLELINKIVHAKMVADTAKVNQLVREAAILHCNRSEDNDLDFAEEKIRQMVLFFAR